MPTLTAWVNNDGQTNTSRAKADHKGRAMELAESGDAHQVER